MKETPCCYRKLISQGNSTVAADCCLFINTSHDNKFRSIDVKKAPLNSFMERAQVLYSRDILLN
jgi:hypothetical protein